MKFSIPGRLLQRVRGAILLAFFGLAVFCFSGASVAAVYVSVTIAPPPIPVYAQPICPGPGYIWTPGYWAYGPAGWYWVAGAWVVAPFVGALWTPGYWGWSDGYYRWHAGYWGRSVGFYGGIHYGFGYTGHGYSGGYWRGNAFYYNSAVNNVNTGVVHTTYRTAVNDVTTSRVSYYGGRGGTTARPTAGQLANRNQPNTAVTAAQVRRENAASPQRPRVASANEPLRAGSITRHQTTTVRNTPMHNAQPNAERTRVASDQNASRPVQRQHSASLNTVRTQGAAASNPQPDAVRAQRAPARYSPARVARTQAPSSPHPAMAHPGGGHAQERRVFADAAHAQPHVQGAPQGRPQGGRGGPEEGGGEGRHRG